MENIIEGLERSNLYAEFRWKRFEKFMRPYLAVTLLGWMAWMIAMMVGTAESASNVVYYLN